MQDPAKASDEARGIALYSVLIGGYETLNEQPVIAEAVEPGVRRILLTDDPTLRSEFWEVHVVEPAFAADPVRSQRLLKVVGHPILDEVDVTVYVDNAVTLRTPPRALADELLGDHDIALPLHSYRASVLDEFDEVLRLQYDEQARVYEQLVAYAQHHEEALRAQPYWTAMMVRRRTERVAAAMRTWADHVLRYSRRDQLSARVAIDRLDVHAFVLDNMESPHHAWPADLGRRVAQGKSLQPAAGPLLAEVRRRDRAVEEAEARAAEAQAAAHAVEDAKQALEREVVTLRDVVSLLEVDVARERALRATASDSELAERARAAGVRAEFERSTSWRATAPLRRLGALRRRARD